MRDDGRRHLGQIFFPETAGTNTSETGTPSFSARCSAPISHRSHLNREYLRVRFLLRRKFSAHAFGVIVPTPRGHSKYFPGTPSMEKYSTFTARIQAFGRRRTRLLRATRTWPQSKGCDSKAHRKQTDRPNGTRSHPSMRTISTWPPA